MVNLDNDVISQIYIIFAIITLLLYDYFLTLSNMKFLKHKKTIITTTILMFILIWYILFLPSELFSSPYSTLLYSKNGELLGAKVATDGQWRFPTQTRLPDKYMHAVKEYEDRRFHKHIGVSIPAIFRATSQNIKANRVISGGSTITMQLSRMSLNNPPRTIPNKLFEMILATRIEWSYTKDEILSIYAAHAPFGGNVVGIEAASWRYFGHNPSHLSWAEASTLAVLPNSPALIHLSRGRDKLLNKRNKLLNRLLEVNIIDSLEHSAALLEPIPDAPEALPRYAPHLMDRLEEGSTMHSTLDLPLQQRTQQIVDNYGNWTLAVNHIRNAAVLVADVNSGEILAYVGNITESNLSSKVNDGRAVDIIQSRRSTGSLLKPILYSALINDGKILPNTLIFDTPLNISGFTPSNYNKTFSGVVSARSVIEKSLNVPIVRMLSMYNNSRFLKLLKTLGLTTLDRSADNYGATLILGGAEGTLFDMCGLYSSLARSLNTYNETGKYNNNEIRPLTTEKHNSSDSLNEINKSSPLSPSSLWFMFDAMSGVNRPEEEASWQVFSSMKQVAWKTGTSYGNRDAWAIGLTPRYIVGVWVGNADGEGRASMTGVGDAAPIMFDIFSMLPAADKWFTKPLDDIENMAICRRSGHKATEWCHSSVDIIDTLAMPLSGVSTTLCPFHKPVTNNGVTKGWFILPPTAEYYYIRSASDYVVPPAITGIRPMELVYPQHNSILYLPKGFSAEQFIFHAVHRSDSASIHWHLDNNYIMTTYSDSTTEHKISLSPSAGLHWLTIVDNLGNSQRINFTVLTSKDKNRQL